ncbi:MAG: hypothetical protein ACI8RA_002102 [Chlamydiales bacterium]|jgi:hypothetical protein
MTTLGDTEIRCSQLLHEIFPTEEAMKYIEVRGEAIVSRISKIVERDLAIFQEKFACSNSAPEEALKLCYKHLSGLYPDDLNALISQLSTRAFPELKDVCKKVKEDNSKTLDLIEALRDSRYDEALSLLKCITNVDVCDESGNTALAMASKRGYVDVVRVLLEIGANINTQDERGIQR